MTDSSRAPGLLNRLLSEPLVSFALIGGLLFGLYSVVADDDKPELAVPAAAIDVLVAERELVLERQLTKDERETLRQNFIDQEVLVREAMARKLYLNDGQVRHRLADKMFYLLSDSPAEPTVGELDAFYESRKSNYMTPERVSFSHRFFGDDQELAARSLELPPAELLAAGERFYMGADLDRYAAAELVAIFGTEFTKHLGDLPVNKWTGPLRSSRGWHIVNLREYEGQQQISKDALQGRLALDWRTAQMAKSRRGKLDELRDNYRIVTPEPVVDD